MDVLHLEFKRRSRRRLCDPQIQIFVLPSFKKHIIVARPFMTQIINHFLCLLPLYLGFLLVVWNHLHYIVHEMPKSSSKPSGPHDEHSLPVFPLLAVWVCVLKRSQLVFGILWLNLTVVVIRLRPLLILDVVIVLRFSV